MISEESVPLPPTVNMHILGHCNFACRYCYARFVTAQTPLPLSDAEQILRGLALRGVERVSFAGGEPTLHPELLAMLKICAELGLVANVVTNASRIDRPWCRSHLPWLRWLTISCDSPTSAINDAHGRRPKARLPPARPVADHVNQVAAWLREWNAARPQASRVRLKINIVVTRLNAHEDPSDWLRSLGPRRIKLLQQVVVPGENDQAADLRCSTQAFEQYARRLAALGDEGITVVAERSEQLHDSYAMVDPRGRFRQSRADGYVTSRPLLELGIDAAWAEVGAYDPDVFVARGGRYAPGRPSQGPQVRIIALEGLDGSGKSTVARLVAERLAAPLVHCPPRHMSEERGQADSLDAAQRRAWYFAAGRTSMESAIDQVFAGRSVVMDRSPATTAAYGAAERGRVAQPRDLPAGMPMPDDLFVLHLPEQLRLQRIHGRDRTLTDEERRLERDAPFRQRVLAGYEALGAIRLDASGPAHQIAAEVVARLGRES